MKPKRVTKIDKYSCPFGGKKFENEKWIYSHPGGINNLQSAYEVEPKASNMLFMSYHTGHDINKCYSIGNKYGYKLPKQTALHKEFNELYLNIQKKYWIHGYMNQIYTFLLTILILICFFWQLFYPSFTSRFSYGAFVLSSNFAIHHTRHHCGTLYRSSKLLDKITKPIYEFFVTYNFGMTARFWIDVHQKSHHIYTNSTEDFDVWNTYPFIWESPYYKIKSFHRYQSFYAPIIFSLLSFTIPIRILFPTNPITKKRISNPIYLLLHILLEFILPLYIHNGSMLPIYLYLAGSPFYAMWYAYLFQVSHNQDKLTHFNYNIDECKIMDNYDNWIKQQIESSMSYNNTYSIFDYCFTMIFGGINCQIEHHVAPSVYPIYHCLAASGFKKICKKHNIKYNERNGFIESIYYYHKYLHDVAANALNKLQ